MCCITARCTRSLKLKLSADQDQGIVWSVGDFVAVFNQTIEYVYPSVAIVGELANFRISKNKWVYFDLKDDDASVRCFGSVYQMPGPLEDGMLVQVVGTPRLHEQFGFSITFRSILPSGEGSIKKASDLLAQKLTKEGLFDQARKRILPYAPTTIGLITSKESAAYKDFVKISSERWGGVDIKLFDVQVQGEAAVGQVVRALEYFNSHETPVEVIVITRGGGSADDLAVFSTEQVTRAVAASRIPTLVAIGHEVDESLAEYAADMRASTPSNAAQLLFPDKSELLTLLVARRLHLTQDLQSVYARSREAIANSTIQLSHQIQRVINNHYALLERSKQVVQLLDPQNSLKRGYAIIRSGGAVIKSMQQLTEGQVISIELIDGTITAQVKEGL